MKTKLYGRSTRAAGLLAAAALVAASAGCAEPSTAEGSVQSVAVATQSGPVERKSVAKESTPAQESVAAEERPLTVAQAMESNHDYWTSDQQTGVTEEIDLASASSDGNLTIREAGTYTLTGQLNGQLIVEAGEDEQVTLILDGVTISNEDGPAVYLKSADGVRIELKRGTTSTLSDAAQYPENAEANAALFSKVDLEIDGEGTLEVTGNGEDGIASKDDLVIVGGNIVVNAVDDGLRGKDALVVTGGKIQVTSAGDGLKTTNEEEADRGYFLQIGGDITVRAGDDGIDSVQDALFTGGTLTIMESVEGIEAVNLLVEGGELDIVASDDGLNSTVSSSTTAGGGGEFGDDGSNLVISGGAVTIDAEGDGIDSNGSLTISGGTVRVYGTVRGGNGAFDANGSFTLSGGDVLALSAGQMEQGPAVVEQPLVEAAVQGESGALVEILAETDVFAKVTAPKQYGYVFYSSPELTEGQQLSISSAGNAVEVIAVLESQNQGMGGPGGGGPGMDGSGMGGSGGPEGAPGTRPEGRPRGEFPGENGPGGDRPDMESDGGTDGADLEST